METKHVLDNSQVRASIAQTLGVTQQTLTNWKQRGIPADRCPDIELATGIKCEILRPDVNWAVLRKVA
jgi:DNA-binding transcriptional regulator YdaS (Cro superfamily)